MLNGKREALPVVTGDLAVRQASSSFLLIQTFGAQLLWYLEGPLALISLQPAFARKVTSTDLKHQTATACSLALLQIRELIKGTSRFYVNLHLYRTCVFVGARPVWNTDVDAAR